MFGFRKSPAPSNPPNQNQVSARRTSSEPVLPMPNPKKSTPFDDDDDDDDYFGKAKPSTIRNKPKNKSDLDSMSTQELEDYAVDQSQETTKSVNNCLKIAQDIKQDATNTLDMLHSQGEQIHRTHEKAVEMEKDLSKGEKILGNIGGMFSMTWKPKKGKEIKGPVISKDDNQVGKKASKEQREKLGLDPKPKGKASKTPPHEPTNAMEQVEFEKQKQDDGLSDLSNILGDLKGMATEMGSELDRQNQALDHLSDDVDELNSRVKGANQRTRKLLGK